LRKTPEYEEAFKRYQMDTKVSSYDIPEEQMDILADAIGNGQQATKQIPKRGKTFASVSAKVLEKYPKFNFTMNDANAKYRNDSNILRSAGLVNAIMPRIQDLYQKGKNLENTFGVPALDKPLNAIKKEFGSELVMDFESLRNAIMFEANTALSGSSVPSDYRIKLELENLASGFTLGQQIKSIENLSSALIARKEASTMMAYPLDVVRGEKTLDAWRKEVERESKMSMNDYPKEESGGLSVIAPDGKTYTFKDEKSANAFRKKIGQ